MLVWLLVYCCVCPGSLASGSAWVCTCVRAGTCGGWVCHWSAHAHTTRRVWCCDTSIEREACSVCAYRLVSECFGCGKIVASNRVCGCGVPHVAAFRVGAWARTTYVRCASTAGALEVSDMLLRTVFCFVLGMSAPAAVLRVACWTRSHMLRCGGMLASPSVQHPGGEDIILENAGARAADACSTLSSSRRL